MPKDRASANGSHQDRSEMDKRTIVMKFPPNYLNSDKQIRTMCASVKSVRFPGVAFVEFNSEADADECYQSFRDNDLGDGRKLTVDYVGAKAQELKREEQKHRTQDKKRLYVRGLARDITAADLRKLFPASTDAFVPRRQKGKHWFGFVSYANEQVAGSVLQSSSGMKYKGQPLIISYALVRPGQQAPQKRKADDNQKPPAKKVKQEPKVLAKEEEDDDEDDGDEDDVDRDEDDVDRDEDGKNNTLKAACIICNDLYLTTDDIYCTPCGHVFHYLCIIWWLERSQSCPQCCHLLWEKYLIKLDVHNTDATDLNSLQNEINNIKLQLFVRTQEKERAESEIEKLKRQTRGLWKEYRSKASTFAVKETEVQALKNEAADLREQLSQSEKEVCQLREKCRKCKQLHWTRKKKSKRGKQLRPPLHPSKAPPKEL